MTEILKLLEQEKARIQSAIDALTGGATVKKRGRPFGSLNKSTPINGESIHITKFVVPSKRKPMSAARKAELSARMRKYWKQRRAQKAA